MTTPTLPTVAEMRARMATLTLPTAAEMQAVYDLPDFIAYAHLHWPALIAMREQQDANLFQSGHFTLASGAKSIWKIECDALTTSDWDGLARIASEMIPPFGIVEGVPRGGIPFADAMRKHVTPGCSTLLIAEDVVTTGGSMERFRAGRNAIGVVAFCRGDCPRWVTPLFIMGSKAMCEELERLREVGPWTESDEVNWMSGRIAMLAASNVRLESELAAAKAEIERLKHSLFVTVE